jgi:hypothetical protein
LNPTRASHYKQVSYLNKAAKFANLVAESFAIFDKTMIRKK